MTDPYDDSSDETIDQAKKDLDELHTRSGIYSVSMAACKTCKLIEHKTKMYSAASYCERCWTYQLDEWLELVLTNPDDDLEECQATNPK